MIPFVNILVAMVAASPDEEASASYLAAREGMVLEYAFSSGGGRKVVVSSTSKRKDGTVVVHEEIKDKKRVPFASWCVRENGVFLLESRVGKYSPELCELQLPLKKGARWTSKASVIDRGSGFELNDSRKFQVVGNEKIKTDAGEFMTVCVEYEGLAAGGVGRGKTWYAKEIGVVKTETSVMVVTAKVPEVHTMILKSISVPKNGER